MLCHIKRANGIIASKVPHARERHPCLVPRAEKDFGALPFTGWFFRVALIHVPSFLLRTKMARVAGRNTSEADCQSMVSGELRTPP